MQFTRQVHVQKQICDTYQSSQAQVLGIRSMNTCALISQNKVVIISKSIPTSTDQEKHISIRGRRIDPILNQMKQEQYHALMKERLTEITGYRVLSIESHKCMNNEKIEVYCFDHFFSTF